MLQDLIDKIGIDNIVVLSCSMVSFIGGLFIAKFNLNNPLKNDVYKIQLEKIYLPIFRFLEPYLYKKISKKTRKELFSLCDDIFEENYQYVLSDTLNNYKLYKKYSNDNYCYKNFSKNIDKTYEMLKAKLKLPKRKFLYKFNNKQYSNKLIFVIWSFLKTYIIVISIVVCILSLLVIIKALFTIISAYDFLSQHPI